MTVVRRPSAALTSVALLLVLVAARREARAICQAGDSASSCDACHLDEGSEASLKQGIQEHVLNRWCEALRKKQKDCLRRLDPKCEQSAVSVEYVECEQTVLQFDADLIHKKAKLQVNRKLRFAGNRGFGWPSPKFSQTDLTLMIEKKEECWVIVGTAKV